MESGRKPADDRVLPHDKTARCVMIGLRRLQLILMGADSMRFVVYRQSHGDRNALPQVGDRIANSSSLATP